MPKQEKHWGNRPTTGYQQHQSPGIVPAGTRAWLDGKTQWK